MVLRPRGTHSELNFDRVSFSVNVLANFCRCSSPSVNVNRSRVYRPNARCDCTLRKITIPRDRNIRRMVLDHSGLGCNTDRSSQFLQMTIRTVSTSPRPVSRLSRGKKDHPSQRPNRCGFGFRTNPSRAFVLRDNQHEQVENFPSRVRWYR